MDVDNRTHFQSASMTPDSSDGGPIRHPGQRDPERTQRAIIEAATAEFAEKGFAGASVNEIAAAANVNKRMLYHYFGKKEELYLLVLERALARLRSVQTDMELSQLPPHEAIAQFIRFTWDYFRKNPDILRIFSGENLMRAQHLQRSRRIKDLRRPISSKLEEIIERGVANKTFRSDVDVMQLYITISSLTYYYLSARHTLSVLYGSELSGDAAVDARADHIIEVVRGYLRP
jgi:AcrR family transcriptional regulator